MLGQGPGAVPSTLTVMRWVHTASSAHRVQRTRGGRGLAVWMCTDVGLGGVRLCLMRTRQMRLEYTALHHEFVEFFEQKLEKVIASVGSTVKDFYQKLKAADRADSSSADARFTQVRC